MVTYILASLAVLSAGALLYAAVLLSKLQKQPKTELKSAPDYSSDQHVLDAQTRAKEVILEAKNEVIELKRKAEEEAQSVKREGYELEKRLDKREESIERRIEDVERQRQQVTLTAQSADKLKHEFEKNREEQTRQLERVANLSQKDARNEVLGQVQKSLQSEITREINAAQETARESADEQVREILGTAMQRAATNYVAEYTTATMTIPDDEMKGRIIGKEGRNIRAFEMATGADVIVDETPGAITISCFDGMRREIAKAVMQELISDGRIHPGRIETVAAQCKERIEKMTYEIGKQMTYDAGVTELPKEIVQLLGQFKYRTSYGQNMIKHTLEVVNLGKILAAELGADVEIVKRGALLHDIGKVLTADVEGSHVDIGVELLKRHRIDERVIDAVAAHHEDNFDTLEALIVYVADAISGARPGARREDQETYIRRVKELENVASEFEGVEQVYAISAGREVRVIVKPKRVDDTGTVKLAHDIADKIHKTMTYPGQVKVTVVRDFRASAVAK